jgi:hypothetical protein
MPARKPLVLIDGQIQQLPAADTVDAASAEVDVIGLTNGGGSSAPGGAPVHISAAYAFNLSRANAGATVQTIGLVRDPAIAAAAAGNVQTDGVLTLTTGQWDAVTGETGGLVAGGIYFLSATIAGRLTRTAPNTSGQYVLQIGKAVAPQALEISITVPILL